jgi:hypothetical protein
MRISLSWDDFKTQAIGNGLSFVYLSSSSAYSVYALSGNLILETVLARNGGADVIEFETTYRALASSRLYLDIRLLNSYRNLTGNATATVKSGAGYLHAIAVNDNNTGGTITIYDNTAASGTKIATLQLATPSGGLLSTTGLQAPVALPIGVVFTTGLTIVTAGSSNNDITVCYK